MVVRSLHSSCSGDLLGPLAAVLVHLGLLFGMDMLEAGIVRPCGCRLVLIVLSAPRESPPLLCEKACPCFLFVARSRVFAGLLS